MKKLLKTPYPRPPINSYLIISASIAGIINFILIVFQPFGTAQFQHPYKLAILSAYGIVVFITLSLYFSFSKKVIYKGFEGQWNIIFEVLDLLISTLLAILATYFYFIWVFKYSFSWQQMFSYMGYAASVALLPIAIYLAYLFYTWKDVIRSSFSANPNKQTEILLKGQNKGDLIKTHPEKLLFAKAHDNYVILYLQSPEGKVQRHIIRSPLKDLKAQIETETFKFVHRSYLVNLQKVDKLEGNKSKARLQIEGIKQAIPLSRTYYDEIKTLV